MISNCTVVHQCLRDALRNQYGQRFDDFSVQMIKAPGVSTIRINSLVAESSTTIDDAFIELNALLNPKGFSVSMLPSIPNCALVQPSSTQQQQQQQQQQQLQHHEKRVIVDEAAGYALLRGAHLYARGVMGVSMNARQGDVVSVWIDVDRTLTKGAGGDIDSNAGRSFFVGNGVLRQNRSEIFTNESGVAVEMREQVTKAPSFSELSTARFYPQFLPSQLTVEALFDDETKRRASTQSLCCLDMCASPGGKTTHFAAMLRAHAANDRKHTLFACDRSQSRVDALIETCRNLRAFDVGFICIDSRKLVETPPKPKTVHRFATDSNLLQSESILFTEQMFDLILLDPICSGSGQRPQIELKHTLKEIEGIAQMQFALLLSAHRMLKPGGRLLFSTCSITLLENEANVERFLQTHRDMKLVKTTPKIGGDAIANGFHFTAEQCSFMQRFDPLPELVDCIGFFFAMFEKANNSSSS